MHPSPRMIRALLIVVGLLLLGSPATLRADSIPPGTAPGPKSIRAVTRLEPNRGQAHPRVDFVARCRDYTAFLSPDGVTLACRGDHLRFVPIGGRPLVSGRVEGEVLGRSHFLKGRPVRGVPQHRSVIYREVWPGIDVRFLGAGRRLRFDLLVSPGADVSAVRLLAQGAREIQTVATGELVLTAGRGRAQLSAPLVHQVVGGETVRVPGRFVVRERGVFGFEIGPYDRNRPLVIDPTFDYATFLGGTGQEYGITSLGLDADGNVYVAGRTFSDDFPTTVGAWDRKRNDGSPSSWGDLCVSKLDPAGEKLLWSTYLGGTHEDLLSDLTVSTDGVVTLCGTTRSNDYPSTTGAWSEKKDTDDTSVSKGFLTRLTADGSALAWSTWLNDELPEFVCVDSDGGVRLASRNMRFGMLPDPSTMVIRNVKSDGSGIDWTTSLSSSDIGGRILPKAGRLDASGHLFVGGNTNATDLPVTQGVYQAKLATPRHMDGFLLELDERGTVRTLGYFGGTDLDDVGDIDLDARGNIYLCGRTASTDHPVTTDAFQKTNSSGNYAAFLARFSPDGSRLTYSTLIGGNERGVRLATHVTGYTWISGITWYKEFPTKNAWEDTYQSEDGFLARFDSRMRLTFSTFVSSVHLNDLALRSDGSAVAGGKAGDGVTTDGVYQETAPGNGDQYVIEFADELPTTVVQLGGDLPPGTLDHPYSAMVSAEGGAAPYGFAVDSGRLPTGLSLSGDGRLSGTPAATGEYEFAVTVTDDVGVEATRVFRVVISDRVEILRPRLPDWTVDVPYHQGFWAHGGSGALSFEVVSGALPSGLSIDDGGILTGMPTATGLAEFTVVATDTVGAATSAEFAIRIHPQPVITLAELPRATRESAYSEEVTGTGGTPDCRHVLPAGELPPGLVLGADGTIAGVPEEAGVYGFTIVRRDACSAEDRVDLLLTVADEGLLATGKCREEREFSDAANRPFCRSFDLLAGTLLTAKVRMRGRGTLEADLRLLDREGAPIDVSDRLKVKGKSARLKKFRAPRTGRYFLVLEPRPGFAGTVRLQVSARPARKWKEEAAVGGDESPIEARVAAAPGSRLQISVRASKGSAAVPSVVAVRAADGTDLLPLALVREKPGRVTLRLDVPFPGGDISIRIIGRDGIAGDLKWSAKAKPPRGYPFTIPDR